MKDITNDWKPEQVCGKVSNTNIGTVVPPFTGLLGGSEKSTVNGAHGIWGQGACLNSGLRKLIISLNGCLLPFIIFTV